VKRVPRGAIAWLVVVVAAFALHTIGGRVLAGEDVVAAVLVGRGATALLAAFVLVSSRLFLYLLAPAWALHVAVRAFLER
jgi:hypothetical protein